MSGIFKAYDIRGSYPDELNESTARSIGASFVRLLEARTIVAGRDMRPSATSLAQAFVEGAAAAGASVTDAGMVTTPLLYYAIIAGKFDGGVMVTASHLPGGMNGFKLCREKAIPLSGDQGLPALEKMVKEGSALQPPLPSPGSKTQVDLVDGYINTLARFVHQPKPLSVVVDAGNGMAGPEVYRLFERIPAWRLIPMSMDPDGSFPHHVPNPLLPASTKDLQERVKKEKADLGVAFDGDADRAGFIDEKGARIAEDLVTALIAEFLLSKEPGAAILYDLRSSRVVPETIAALGDRLDHLDGLTAEYGSWRFNLRPSNTEPVIRLNLEAENDLMLEEKKKAVLKVITETDPGANIVT
jgi:phosphomannomutase